MKTIYLHIGLGKTGTTYIQQLMANNYDFFLAQGLHYIPSGGGSRGVGHQQFAKSFIEKLPDYMIPPKKRCDTRKNIISAIKNSPCKYHLLSSENFILANPTLIRDFFENSGSQYTYKVILFVRSQDELAESEYNQLIKVRQTTIGFNGYIEKLFEGDFYSIAEKWSKVIGKDNLICRVYDARSTELSQNFLNCLPINNVNSSSIVAPTPSSENKSLGAVALSTKLMINSLIDLDSENSHFEVSRTLSDELQKIDFPAVLLNSQQAKQMRQKYRESNRKFSKKYLGVAMDDLGGRRYTDQERDNLYHRASDLLTVKNIRYSASISLKNNI